MKQDSVSFRFIKNASYSFIGYVWPIFFSIFLTPYIVFSLGIKDYGIYIFLNTLISLAGLLDLGITNAIIKYASEYITQNQNDKLKKVLYSGNLIYLILGTTGLIFFTFIPLISNSFENINQITSNNPEYYSTLFIISGLIFFINCINSIYNIIPIALQRFDIGSKIGIAQNTIQSVLIFFSIYMGFGIITMLCIQIFSLLVCSLWSRSEAKKLLQYSELKFLWDREEILKCYKFGFTIIINNIGISSLNYLNRLIIPFYLGPSQLTYYSLPGNISNKVPDITSNISGSLFPLVSSVNSLSNNTESLRSIYKRSTEIIIIFCFAFTIPLIAISYKTLEIWLSKDFADTAHPTFIILLVTGFLIGLFKPTVNFIFGLNRLKMLNVVSVVIAISNLFFLILLLPRYGIVGAALSYAISMLPVFYLLYYIENKILSLENRFRYYVSLILKNIFVGLIIFFVGHYILNDLINNIYHLILIGPLLVFMYIFIYYHLNFFEKKDSDDIVKYIRFILIRTNILKN